MRGHCGCFPINARNDGKHRFGHGHSGRYITLLDGIVSITDGGFLVMKLLSFVPTITVTLK
jgi:hypothetical protein